MNIIQVITVLTVTDIKCYRATTNTIQNNIFLSQTEDVTIQIQHKITFCLPQTENITNKYNTKQLFACHKQKMLQYKTIYLSVTARKRYSTNTIQNNYCLSETENVTI